MNRSGLMFLLIISLFPAAGSGQSFIISGYVYDIETGRPLAVANILNRNNGEGTATTEDGSFTLLVQDSLVSLTFTYVGYKPVTKKIELWQGINLRVGIIPGTELDEIIISDSIFNEPVINADRILITKQKIQSLPVFLSEPDVLKSLQLMPGVQSGTEGSAGIYVRGGGPDQNLILLDYIPVYNADHLFGFFSSFNPGIIDNVELIKGGFPARYGGRLSSVINIETREGNDEEFQMEGSVGLVTGSVAVSGPVIKNKLTFVAGLRRSYLDLFLVPISWLGSGNDVVYGYYFQDINGKLNWRINEWHKSYLTFYKSLDKGFTKINSKYVSTDSPAVEIKDLDKINLKWGNTILSAGIESE